MGVHSTDLSTFLYTWNFNVRVKNLRKEKEFSTFLYEYKCWLQPTANAHASTATTKSRNPVEISQSQGGSIPKIAAPSGAVNVGLVWIWRDSFRRLSQCWHQPMTRAKEENGRCYELNVKTHSWIHMTHTLGVVPSCQFHTGISLSHKCWKYSSLESAVCHVQLKKILVSI